jgi:predicted DNA-binding WGR domain protein
MSKPKSTPAPIVKPSGDPAIRRKFSLFEPGINSNKEWLVEAWPLPSGEMHMVATWGRVGTTMQEAEKVCSRAWVDKKIAEKLAKGYTEVSLAAPMVVHGTLSATATTAEPKVQTLLGWIFSEAKEAIQTYLKVPVNALGADQIAKGRRQLAAVQDSHRAWSAAKTVANEQALLGAVTEFYRRIPTKLPHKIDPVQLVRDFVGNFREQEDRLDQLEAAIATLAVGGSQYNALGAEITLLSGALRGKIIDYVLRTQGAHFTPRVQDVFEVEVPAERARFKANTIGMHDVRCLFHGTASKNIRHILRSGLKVPTTKANGWMFGPGIYLADCSTKSGQYSSSDGRGVPEMLLVCDGALGTPYIAPEAKQFDRAPSGYDSVWGKQRHTKSWSSTLQYNEHIVYNPAQVTIRYLVTFTR